MDCDNSCMIGLYHKMDNMFELANIRVSQIYLGRGKLTLGKSIWIVANFHQNIINQTPKRLTKAIGLFV